MRINVGLLVIAICNYSVSFTRLAILGSAYQFLDSFQNILKCDLSHPLMSPKLYSSIVEYFLASALLWLNVELIVVDINILLLFDFGKEKSTVLFDESIQEIGM